MCSGHPVKVPLPGLVLTEAPSDIPVHVQDYELHVSVHVHDYGIHARKRFTFVIIYLNQCQ